MDDTRTGEGRGQEVKEMNGFIILTYSPPDVLLPAGSNPYCSDIRG